MSLAALKKFPVSGENREFGFIADRFDDRRAVDTESQRGFEIRVLSLWPEPLLAKRLVLFRGELEPEMIEDRIEEFPGRGVSQAVEDQNPGVAAQLRTA